MARSRVYLADHCQVLTARPSKKLFISWHSPFKTTIFWVARSRVYLADHCQVLTARPSKKLFISWHIPFKTTIFWVARSRVYLADHCQVLTARRENKFVDRSRTNCTSKKIKFKIINRKSKIIKNSVLRLQHPGSGAFFTPGSGMGKNPVPGSGMKIRDSFWRTWYQFFWVKNT